MALEFIDLKTQQARLKPQIDAAIAKVLAEGRYVMGPEVSEFEHALAGFGEAKHALGCANGTDALLLPMMAWRIGRGDAVFCPSFTFSATAEAIALLGATPVFVDVDRDTYNMDAENLEAAIAQVKADGDLVPRAVITVDLFGQCADYEALTPVVRAHGLKLIADSAQGFGTRFHDRQPIHWADVTTTSFFPAKPLGCYGDGGAVLTNDDELAADMDSLRIHGKGTDKYDNVRVGLNSRLDTLQAAILLEKLTIFTEEIATRNVIAHRYIDGLRSNSLRVPHVLEGILPTWAQFTIEVSDPDRFANILKTDGIPTARYYPRPIHRQTAYQHCPVSPAGLANTEASSQRVISLPMHAYLPADTQARIIETAQSALS